MELWPTLEVAIGCGVSWCLCNPILMFCQCFTFAKTTTTTRRTTAILLTMTTTTSMHDHYVDYENYDYYDYYDYYDHYDHYMCIVLRERLEAHRVVEVGREEPETPASSSSSSSSSSSLSRRQRRHHHLLLHCLITSVNATVATVNIYIYIYIYILQRLHHVKLTYIGSQLWYSIAIHPVILWKLIFHIHTFVVWIVCSHLFLNTKDIYIYIYMYAYIYIYMCMLER